MSPVQSLNIACHSCVKETFLAETSKVDLETDSSFTR